MPQVEITMTEPDGSVAKGLLPDFDRLMQSVQKRAYELFEGRGRARGALPGGRERHQGRI